MALDQNDEVEYMTSDYCDEFNDDDDDDDDLFEENHRHRRSHGEEWDFLEEEDHGKQKADTSASEARNGKDIQGIQWDRMNFTRDKYREIRLKQYNNFTSMPYSLNELEKECRQVKKDNTFYDFQFNTRVVKPTIAHFQLRNLLWATSKHDLYLMHNYSVMHWSSVLRRSKEMLNVSGHISPTVKPHGCQIQPLSKVLVSTMSVKENLMVAGGFQGELICKHLNRPGVSFCSKITNDENAITNTVDIYRSATGLTRLMAANNDCHVRVYDCENFTLLNQFVFSWSVNNTSVSPDGKILAVLGDSVDSLLVDVQSGKAIGHLKGHIDYSFSSAWHPNGQVLATGNQDTTCRLWDVRKLLESLAVLKGRMAAIRAMEFTADGKYLAMAEAADFVHIFDTQADYCKAQEIDLFGEVAGISFSPDTESLFVGVADRTYGSVLEFSRRRFNRYLDSYM